MDFDSNDPIDLSNKKIIVLGVFLIFISNLMWLFAILGSLLSVIGYFSSMGSQGSMSGDSPLADLALYLALVSDIAGFSLFGFGMISNRSPEDRSPLMSGSFFISWALVASIWRAIFIFHPTSVIANVFTHDSFLRIVDFSSPLRILIGILFSFNGILMLLGIYFFTRSNRYANRSLFFWSILNLVGTFGYGFHIIFVGFILADPTNSPPLFVLSALLKQQIIPLIGVISFYKTKLMSIMILFT